MSDKFVTFPDDSEDLQFSGSDYVSEYDQARLTGQLKILWDLMIDGEWRTQSEIGDATGYQHSSITAQLRNLRKPKFGSHTTPKRIRGERANGLWEYCLVPNPNWKSKDGKGGEGLAK
jgi:hypothetical protein